MLCSVFVTAVLSQGVVDLVKMKAIVWNGEELGAKFEEQDIPADLQELANEYREKMIDMIVEQDDAVSGVQNLLTSGFRAGEGVRVGGSGAGLEAAGQLVQGEDD